MMLANGEISSKIIRLPFVVQQDLKKISISNNVPFVCQFILWIVYNVSITIIYMMYGENNVARY